MIFLVASLALNALLLGVIMRGLWIARANIVMTGGAIETSLPAFVSTLPASRREELRRSSLAEQPAAIRPLRRELRRARTEAYRAFIAEPFDKAAFVAAQNRLFEAESNLRRTMQHLLPEMGERLTAAERRAYMSWRGHGWGGGRRGDRGDRGVSRDLDQPGVSPRRE
jgi:uncharacterized membrane protein